MAAPRIGFVGIGTMGAPMARRVLGGGYALTIFDADEEKSERLAAEIQCRRATSLADLARDADIVITMLPNGNIVRDVMFGDDGIASTLRPGGILLDMSSADATVCLQCATINQVAYSIAPDGSCQPPPTITATVAWGASSATFCSSSVLVVSTDPNDQHVIAAAKRGGADAIVTANLADFPNGALAQLGLHAVSADDFLLDLADLDEWTVARVVVEQASATGRPPLAPAQVLAALGAAGVPRFVDAIGPAVDKLVATS